MRYRTQAVAYPYFVVAMLFYGLQMAFGLLAVAKYLGPDPIKAWLPFDVVKEIHTNLLIVWVLTIVDIIRRGYSGGTTAGYIALIVILPLIGSAIYWAVRKPSAAEVEQAYRAEADIRRTGI